MFENGVTVTFNAEGGKLNGMDKWIEEIAEENGAWNINLADFVPEREGYDFLGWGVSSSAADTTVLSVDDLASSDAALRGMQFSSVNGGTDYTLYAKWQNATGFDYLYDEDTKELTITNDQGMNVFYEAMTEKQLKEVEKLVMLEGVSDLGSFDYSVMTSLKTLVISPGIKRITDGRFQNMPSLEQVVIPASVTGIFNSAFADCPKLKTVSFEDNEADPIKSADNLSIEENAFAHCDISEIHFPRQLYSLGSRVFEGCPLTDVYFQEARFSSSQYINLADTNYSAYGSFDLAGAAVKLHFPESIADAYKEKVIPNYAQIINPPEDFIRYPVSVNGETFHSQRLEIPCGEGYAAFDPLTMTLTLHDADITVGNSVGYAGFNQDSHTGISAACDSLTIILEGSNTLSGEKGGAYYDSEQGQWAQKQWGAYGIEVLGDLTITGGGSLTMETAEGESPRLMKAKNLTIKNTEVNASGSDVEPSGDMLTENSVFSFGNLTINDNITATFRNSTVAMKGKMTVYSTLARVIFDGGDFTGETADQYTSDLFYSYGDTSLISYRGDTGILSGAWYGSDHIHIGTMETVTDAGTNVKLANLGNRTYTVTPLGSEELLRAEAALQKKSAYKDYICVFGYEITVDPALTDLLTVMHPSTVPLTAFTCTEGDSAKASILGSQTADGFCRFSTDKGGKFFFAIPNQAADYQLTITDILPVEATPTITLTNGGSTQELHLEAISETATGYTATIDNNYEAVVNISAPGYQSRTFTRPKGSTGDWNISAVTLEPIPSSGVILTSIKSSDGRTFNGFDGLNPVLKDDKRTLEEGSDYTLSYPYILLSSDYVNNASANGTLTLTVTPDDALALTPGSAEKTLSELTFRLQLTAWGKAEIAVTSDFISFNNLLIFNEEGALVESGTVYGGKSYVTTALPQGGYTAVSFNSNTRFSVFSSLAQMQAAGLVEGKEHAAASFRIQNDTTTNLSMTIPALTLPETENAHQASVSLYPGNVMLGNVFRVKVEYDLAKEVDGNVSVTLPNDSEVVYISQDNHVYPIEQAYDAKTHTVTVPVSD